MPDLAQRMQELQLRFLLISFTDLFGIQRAKLVPASAVAGMARDGAGFAGFAAWLDLSPADGDVMAIPAEASLTPLPWQPGVRLGGGRAPAQWPADGAVPPPPAAAPAGAGR